jgi:hypothetical protein
MIFLFLFYQASQGCSESFEKKVAAQEPKSPTTCFDGTFFFS